MTVVTKAPEKTVFRRLPYRTGIQNHQIGFLRSERFVHAEITQFLSKSGGFSSVHLASVGFDKKAVHSPRLSPRTEIPVKRNSASQKESNPGNQKHKTGCLAENRKKA